MALYQLYVANPSSGRFDREVEIEAEDDVAAIRVASREENRPLELWQGDRKVHRFESPAARERRRTYDPLFLKPSKSLLTWGQGSDGINCKLEFRDRSSLATPVGQTPDQKD